MTAGRINALDGWRAISVAMVVICHLASYLSIAPGGLIARLLDPYGGLGVRIFFVLSGFVICRGLLHEEQGTGRASIPAFYVRRAFRILPPLLLFLAAIAVLSGLKVVPAQAIGALYGLTFTCNLDAGRCGGYLGAHLWSLSVEEQFYLVFPLLFICLRGSRRLVLTGLAIALPLVALGLIATGQHMASTLASQFICIAAGVACALNERPILRALQGREWLAPLAAGLMLCDCQLAALPHGSAVYTLTLAPLIALALMGSIAGGSRFRSSLETPALVAVGRVSYSIYLWQQLATFRFQGAGWLFYALAIVAVIATAFASYRWIERPLLRLGHRLSERASRFSRPLSTQSRPRTRGTASIPLRSESS